MNRGAKQRRVVEESAREPEEQKPKPKRRQRSIAALYSSWGGADCLFFFRWAGAEIGHHAQAIELPAETVIVGKRPLPFWDHSLGDLPKLKRRIDRLEERLRRMSSDPAGELAVELDALRRAVAAAGAADSGAARPGSIGGTRVRTTADRVSDAHLAAAKRYRRVLAGMRALQLKSPASYEILSATFLPRRLAPEIEREWRQLAWLAFHSARVEKAHESALEQEPTLTRETWLLRRIERGDGIVKLAMEDAETAALEAIQAYEQVTTPPKEILEAQKEQEEARVRGPDRKPRRRGGGVPFAPELTDGPE